MNARSAGERPGLLRGLDVVLAAVGVIAGSPVRQHRLLAVEEQQLDGERVAARLEHARQLDQKGGARSAVVGAHEAELTVEFRVVVAADDDPLGARAGDGGDHVRHPDGAQGRLGREGLLGCRHADGRHLLGDVAAGGFEPLGSGRARPDSHELPDVFVSPSAIELRRRIGAGRRQRAEHQSRRRAATASSSATPPSRARRHRPRRRWPPARQAGGRTRRATGTSRASCSARCRTAAMPGRRAACGNRRTRGRRSPDRSATKPTHRWRRRFSGERLCERIRVMPAVGRQSLVAGQRPSAASAEFVGGSCRTPRRAGDRSRSPDARLAVDSRLLSGRRQPQRAAAWPQMYCVMPAKAGIQPVRGPGLRLPPE